jgi:RND superfamily putative drug exporter
VGGPAAALDDYGRATSARLLPIVLALALVTALLLAFVLRSIGVALIGVALNLLGVGATLGILDRVFAGPLDATALTAVFAVMFALATDYQVFVVTRVREELLRGASASEAVAAGVARTARVVTGAALSMVAVFLAFGTADVAGLRQFGIGLAIAVAIDATVIRLVLLPAALRLAGERAWWPGPADPDAARVPLWRSSQMGSGSWPVVPGTTSTSTSSATS